MKYFRIIIPLLITTGLTAGCILVANWLTGLVPDGDWAGFIRAAIVIFIVGGTLLVIAWSAYFTYTVRKSLKE